MANDYFDLEKIYNSDDYKSKGVEILNEHLKIEMLRLQKVSKTKNDLSAFYNYNINTLQYIRENIGNSFCVEDPFIYLYSFFMFRYGASNDIGIYKKWYYKWTDSHHANINMDIARVFASVQYSDGNDIVQYIENELSSYRKIEYLYRLCRCLLYDQAFMKGTFNYRNEISYGSYILYDVMTVNISYLNPILSIQWMDTAIKYFENHSYIIDGIQNYFVVLFELRKCLWLSYSDDEKKREADQIFNTITLPAYDVDNFSINLHLFHSNALTFLSNIGHQSCVIKLCDEILEKFEKSSSTNLEQYRDDIISKKIVALQASDFYGYKEWFTKSIMTLDITKIKNFIYSSPYMMNNEDDHDVIYLYHYSTTEALESIVENGELWLTRYDFLNDPKELNLIVQVVKDRILNNNDDLNNYEGMLNRCVRLLEYFFNNQENVNDLPVCDVDIIEELRSYLLNMYVLSTSLIDDNLCLWYNYSKGDGCSIKINQNKLVDQIKKINNQFPNRTAHLFSKRVDYLNVSSIDSLIKSLDDIYNIPNLNDLQKMFWMCIHILFQGIFSKNEKMNQEGEYRIAVILNNNNMMQNWNFKTHYKRINNTFRPYIKIKVKPEELLEEVCIAPLNKNDLTVKGFKEYLSQKGLRNCNIKKSMITLRF